MDLKYREEKDRKWLATFYRWLAEKLEKKDYAAAEKLAAAIRILEDRSGGY